MKTEIFSKGLYSTYIYLKSLNSAFDCGEGLSTTLGPRCFGIQKLFISHGHIDHISGIAPLIGIRSAGFGDKSTPLTVYYPKGSAPIENLIGYINTMRKPKFDLSWQAIEPDTKIDLGNNRFVVPFEVEHCQGSLGFSIIEKREKLKEEFTKLLGNEIKKIKESGVSIVEQKEHIIWAYSGDASSLPIEKIKGADWLFCDTTFLKEGDRDEKTHMTLNEAIKYAKEADIKRLVAMHISPRYSYQDIKCANSALLKELPESRMVLPDKIQRIEKDFEKKEIRKSLTEDIKMLD
jgi:ribonuclease Z